MDSAASAQALAAQTHDFLVTLDPSRWSSGSVADRRAAVHALHAAAAAVPDGALAREVDALRRTLSAPASDAQRDWLRLRDDVSPVYEALVTALRARGVNAPSLHPTNYRRTVFHVLSGLCVVAAFEHVLTPWTAVLVAGAFCAVAWSMELSRRFSSRANDLMMRVFRHIARDHERYRVNSSTWYGTALLLVALTVPNRAGMLGVAALAVGDPAAGWMGRHFGRIRLLRGKSLEGTLAFVIAALGVGAGYLAIYHRAELGGTALVAMALTAAVVGAVTELLSTRLDDNFTVPLAAAWSAAVVQRLLT